MTRSNSRRGFTLIELLVVIAVIGVLLGLLMPAVQKVREAANRAKCTNNLKQMGFAMLNFQGEYGAFPAGYYPDGQPPATFSLTHTGWQFQLLPFLEQDGLWKQSYTWLSANPGNIDTNSYAACGFVMPLFICPSNTRPTIDPYGGVNYECTSYMGCSGTSSSNPTSGDGILYPNSSVRIVDIKDGTSNTIAVGERPCTGDLWFGWGFAPWGTGYGDGDSLLGSQDVALTGVMGAPATAIGLIPPLDPNAATGEIDGAHYWSFHPGGASFLYCDASVHFLAYSANNIFPYLCTRAGGEVFTSP